MFDIVIIGGGIIGCAVANELSKDCKVAVLEKNRFAGPNQSTRNSGVIHAGIYYPKDLMPLKAELCVLGNALMYEFCQKYKIPHKKSGKLVVATNSLEEDYLEDVERIALENGVPYEKLDSPRVKEMEPNVKASSALYFPTSGLVVPLEVLKKVKELSEEKGAVFHAGTEVERIDYSNEFKVQTTKGVFESKFLVNAAGLYSDVVAKMVNTSSAFEMDPIRGESACFTSRKNTGVSMNVYPVPHGYSEDGSKLEIPFSEFNELFKSGKVSKTTGVHLTPMLEIVDGEWVVSKKVTLTPLYTKGKGKEDYGNDVPAKEFYDRIKNFFPNLNVDEIEPNTSGIYAKIKGLQDFYIEFDSGNKKCIHLLNIDSPGVTSSLAIAKRVKEMVRATKLI